MRNSYHVQKNRRENLHGNCIREVEKPKRAIDLGRGKYLDKDKEDVGGWYYDKEHEDWAWVSHSTSWVKKTDAVNNDIPFKNVDKAEIKKTKEHRIVVKLSQVKTQEDWEVYEHNQAIKTHERLKRESGIGHGAHSLPDPDQKDVTDIVE